MNDKETSNKKKLTRREQLIRKRRKRQILLLAVELVLLLVLGTCCYVVSKLDLMQTEELDMDEIYRPSFENDRPTIAEAESTERPTKKETENESETQGGTVADETETETASAEETGTVPESTEDSFVSTDYGTVIDGYWNILLVGVDNSGEGQQILTRKANSDTMIICSINTQTGDIKLASVYRDTYLKMAGESGGYNKANYALMHGSIVDTINTLNQNLDIYLTDYVVVNWASVARCVDLLGGIEADITPELIDVNQGAFNSYVTDIVNTTGMGSVQIWEPGVQHLDGVQTVAYCRVRYGSTDYARTERQREVLVKLLAQLKKIDVTTLIALIDEMLPNIATSISKGDLLQVAFDAFNYSIVDSCGFPFDKYSNSRVGNISIPDPVIAVDLVNNVIKLHQFLYGDNGYSPTSTVRSINDYIGQLSGYY